MRLHIGSRQENACSYLQMFAACASSMTRLVNMKAGFQGVTSVTKIGKAVAIFHQIILVLEHYIVSTPVSDTGR